MISLGKRIVTKAEKRLLEAHSLETTATMKNIENNLSFTECKLECQLSGYCASCQVLQRNMMFKSRSQILVAYHYKCCTMLLSCHLTAGRGGEGRKASSERSIRCVGSATLALG